MLTAQQIAALRDAAAQITDPINDYLIRDIARRIAQAGQMTSTAAYQVWRLQNLGVSQRQLKQELRRLLKLSHQEIRRIFYQSAQSGYSLDVSRFPQVQTVRFEDNAPLQQIVSAAAELAEEDFTNLVQTTGFVNPYGKPEPLTGAYISSCDFAFQQVVTGAASYTDAVRQATRHLAAKGVRVISYESGVHTGLEAAVRRNIMGGLGLMQEKISQTTHDQLECNGWEITAHANSAPDHEPIQGKQYPDAAYQSLNNSLRRRIGTLNCGHAAFPIILGVNRPQYTPEELEKFRTDNEKGVTVDGVHYTGYQATQMQRSLERAIRAQKRKVMVDEAAGDKEKLAQDQTKLEILHQRYKEFSKAAGLRTQYERTEAAGFGEKPMPRQEPLAPVSEPPESAALSQLEIPVDTGPPSPQPEPQNVKQPIAGQNIEDREDVTVQYIRTATPGRGTITYEDGYDVPRHQQEVDFSKWLHDTFGGDIKLLKEVNEDKVSTPDYLWREKLWDLKTATSEKSANSAIRKGLKQIFENPGGIMLDYRGREIDLSALEEIIRKRLWWFKEHPGLDVMIVLSDNDVRVWRYPEKK